MKKLFFSLILLCFTNVIIAQTYPECSDFRIEKISLTDNGFVAVEMSNACTNCTFSGANGCAYAELTILNRFNIADTIASSYCGCLMAPSNSSTVLFLLTTSVSRIPSTDSLRIYFDNCSSPVCNDLAIAENALGIINNKLKSKFNIYPNPSSETINLKYSDAIKIQSICLMDISGRLIKTFEQKHKILNISGVAKGAYFLNIQTTEGNINEKIIIE